MFWIFWLIYFLMSLLVPFSGIGCIWNPISVSPASFAVIDGLIHALVSYLVAVAQTHLSNWISYCLHMLSREWQEGWTYSNLDLSGDSLIIYHYFPKPVPCNKIIHSPIQPSIKLMPLKYQDKLKSQLHISFVSNQEGDDTLPVCRIALNILLIPFVTGNRRSCQHAQCWEDKQSRLECSTGDRISQPFDYLSQVVRASHILE